MKDYDGTEADAMWDAEMAAAGGEDHDHTHEVIMGKRMDRVFAGSRAGCWAFRRANGGFVRPYSGDDDMGEWQI